MGLLLTIAGVEIIDCHYGRVEQLGQPAREEILEVVGSNPTPPSFTTEGKSVA